MDLSKELEGIRPLFVNGLDIVMAHAQIRLHKCLLRSYAVGAEIDEIVNCKV